MPQKVVIDADPGIGDAMALALALVDPNLDVVGITSTAGCVSGLNATRNIIAVVEMTDPPKWPRLGSTDDPIPVIEGDGGPGIASPFNLNGPTGLGDLQFDVAELHHRHESAKLMIDLVRAAPHEITLLTLGPLTNVEIACDRAPEFLSLLKGLLCLGGAIETGGDVTAAAELNICANPEAARTVLRLPAAKTLVPLDVSNRVVLTFEQFRRLQTSEVSRVGRFLQQILPYAFRAHHQYLGIEGIRLNEVVALAALSKPELFERRPMAVDVETRGELTRGMTVFDRRGVPRWQTNIDVLHRVDGQGVLDYFSSIVQQKS